MAIEDFEVRKKEAEDAMRRIGEVIKSMCPANMGFTLLLYDFGEGGNMFYASNAERGDMIKAMTEFIQKQGLSSGK